MLAARVPCEHSRSGEMTSSSVGQSGPPRGDAERKAGATLQPPAALIEQPLSRTRPFGVYAIMLLQLVDVAYLCIQTIAVWRRFPSLLVPSSGDPRAITAVNLIIVTFLVVNILGLYRLQRWAWLLTMMLTGISLLLRIVHYVQGTGPAFSLVAGMLTVFYLNQRTVQQRFRRRNVGSKVRA